MLHLLHYLYPNLNIQAPLYYYEMDTDSEWASEPIAIIGMSCKFSGGASNPDKLWDLMASGQTGWSEIPEDRYSLKGVYHENHERTSTVIPSSQTRSLHKIEVY